MNIVRYALLSISLFALNASAWSRTTVTVTINDGSEVKIRAGAGTVTRAEIREDVQATKEMIKDAVVCVYNRSAELVSGAAKKSNELLGTGVNVVTGNVGGVELATSHPVAAKVTLVAGATAAVAGVTYGTYKLYRHFVPAEQAN